MFESEFNEDELDSGLPSENIFNYKSYNELRSKLRSEFNEDELRSGLKFVMYFKLTAIENKIAILKKIKKIYSKYPEIFNPNLNLRELKYFSYSDPDCFQSNSEKVLTYYANLRQLKNICESLIPLGMEFRIVPHLIKADE